MSEFLRKWIDGPNMGQLGLLIQKFSMTAFANLQGTSLPKMKKKFKKSGLFQGVRLHECDLMPLFYTMAPRPLATAPSKNEPHFPRCQSSRTVLIAVPPTPAARRQPSATVDARTNHISSQQPRCGPPNATLWIRWTFKHVNLVALNQFY